jgi:hypothetical protein
VRKSRWSPFCATSTSRLFSHAGGRTPRTWNEWRKKEEIRLWKQDSSGYSLYGAAGNGSNHETFTTVRHDARCVLTKKTFEVINQRRIIPLDDLDTTWLVASRVVRLTNAPMAHQRVARQIRGVFSVWHKNPNGDLKQVGSYGQPLRGSREASIVRR